MKKDILSMIIECMNELKIVEIDEYKASDIKNKKRTTSNTQLINLYQNATANNKIVITKPSKPNKLESTNTHHKLMSSTTSTIVNNVNSNHNVNNNTLNKNIFKTIHPISNLNSIDNHNLNQTCVK